MLLALQRVHLVGDVRRRDEQVEVELALEPLAHDLHVQQAEEAAAEAEAERLAGLGLPEQRAVVELQLLERVAQVGVLVGVGREEAGEDHRLDVDVARQRLRGRPLLVGQGVADADLGDALDAGDDVADLAGRRAIASAASRGVITPISSMCRRVLGAHRAHRLAGAERAVDDAHEGDDAAVLVVGRVEHERARRAPSRSPSGGGMRSMIASSTAATPWPVLAEMRSTSSGEPPRKSATSSARRSGSAAGRSILFSTGTISRSFSIARWAFASVCASRPCAASTTSSAPSQAASERDTS